MEEKGAFSGVHFVFFVLSLRLKRGLRFVLRIIKMYFFLTFIYVEAQKLLFLLQKVIYFFIVYSHFEEILYNSLFVCFIL